MNNVTRINNMSLQSSSTQVSHCLIRIVLTDAVYSRCRRENVRGGAGQNCAITAHWNRFVLTIQTAENTPNLHTVQCQKVAQTILWQFTRRGSPCCVLCVYGVRNEQL